MDVYEIENWKKYNGEEETIETKSCIRRYCITL